MDDDFDFDEAYLEILRASGLGSEEAANKARFRAASDLLSTAIHIIRDSAPAYVDDGHAWLESVRIVNDMAIDVAHQHVGPGPEEEDSPG